MNFCCVESNCMDGLNSGTVAHNYSTVFVMFLILLYDILLLEL